jgi:hypothetical protein
MRVKSAIWVAAYVRRCHIEGAFAGVRRRGADEAGAVFVKVARLDGTADLFGPAPQTAFDDARPSDRAFVPCLKMQPAPEADVEAYLAREIKFDPDVWIVEVEDRAGRNFLDTLAL